MKKILDIDNSAFYQRAKFQLKIIHIPSYTKITKSERFWRVQILNYSLLSDSDFVIFAQPKIQFLFEILRVGRRHGQIHDSLRGTGSYINILHDSLSGRHCKTWLHMICRSLWQGTFFLVSCCRLPDLLDAYSSKPVIWYGK